MGHPARIGQVAQQTGLTVDTIRFYEKQGLLRRSPRTEGGFRLFGAGEIETLNFVRKARGVTRSRPASPAVPAAI